MTDYIVSARKYRPENFESLVGQDNIARTLKNSIMRGQLAHAYLFCGPRGVGKTSTARIFAKTINCSNPTPDMDPCGKCESCISFAEGRSYCIHELDAASNNGVDDIKALMEQVRIPPQVGKYSVYIIDEVHMLSQSAFNAFLKTLEEPPAHAIFILATTEKHKILPTILSRCQTYDFNRITVDNIVRNLRHIADLEGISIDDESLHVIAMKADGAMRDALTIFDQTVAFCGTDVKYKDVIANLNVLDYEHCFSLVDDFLTGNYQAALLKFDEILAKGFNALHFVSALSSHFRDLIVSKSGGLDALLELPDSLKKRYAEQASRCPSGFLYECLNTTLQCESGYRQSVNPRLHIEFTLLKLSTMRSRMGAVPVSAPQQVARPASQPASNPVAQPATQPVQPVSRPQTVPQPQARAELRPEAQSAPESVLPQDRQQTAPQASETPEAETRVRRRSSKSAGSAISLKSIANDPDPGQDTAASASAANSAPVADAVPSDEVLKSCWSSLVSEYSAQPRLANALESATLEFNMEEDHKTLVFRVFNVAQKKWIEEKRLRELEGKLQRLAGSSKVFLRVDVLPDEESVPDVPYTPTEQAQVLMQNNAEVRTLITDLGFDIK